MTKPATVIDPVCGMTVRVATAEEAGLVVEHGGRTYAFCRAACRQAFVEAPEAYAAAANESPPGEREGHAHAVGEPVIDEGIRRWYESCSCCLGDAYPGIKAQLDAERAAAAAAPAGPGICEGAESAG